MYYVTLNVHVCVTRVTCEREWLEGDPHPWTRSEMRCVLIGYRNRYLFGLGMWFKFDHLSSDQFQQPFDFGAAEAAIEFSSSFSHLTSLQSAGFLIQQEDEVWKEVEEPDRRHSA